MGKTVKNPQISIDIETNKIGLENYHQIKTKKTQIILAGSLRKDDKHILHLKSKDFGLSKRWPTYTITRTGVIYQHYDPNYYSDFMNNKEIDKKSISIVLENMGTLYYDVNKESFVNWINEDCDEKLVYEKLWKNSRYWESYTDQQYNSLVFLSNFLCKEFNIIMDAIGYNVYHDDTINFNGIVCRSNYESEFNDLNPSFDYKKFLKRLNISLE